MIREAYKWDAVVERQGPLEAVSPTDLISIFQSYTRYSKVVLDTQLQRE